VTEREIKLTLPGRFTMPALSLNGDPLDFASLPDQQLRATYYDTADLRMARNGVTLRYRTGETEAPRWTLKLPVGSRDAELERSELNFEAPRREPPLEVRSLVTAFIRGEPLTAVATLRTRRRRTQLIADDEPIAEVADDEVSVVEGRRVVSRFRELEVEALTDGIDLRPLADQLRAAGATEAEPIPKVVRALGSRATAPPEIAPKPVPADGRLADVVAASIADALTRLVRNDPLARLGDPEGVHQLRVAVRRLRSDLRTLGDAVDPRWREEIEPRLRAVADAAADVRDADVMAMRLRSERNGSTAALAPLFETLERQRASARERLKATLDGEAYVALLNDLAAATVEPPAGPADAAAADALASLVLGAWDRLQRRADALDDDSPTEQFHRARIGVKRARYAAELAARSLDGKAADGAGTLGSKLAGLQDLLGEVQDAAVAESLIRDTLSARGAGARYAFEAGRLVERLRSRADDARRAFLEAWPEVRRRRWRKWAM
jgi:CHAD domain-containing protein